MPVIETAIAAVVSFPYAGAAATAHVTMKAFGIGADAVELTRHMLAEVTAVGMDERIVAVKDSQLLEAQDILVESILSNSGALPFPIEWICCGSANDEMVETAKFIVQWKIAVCRELGGHFIGLVESDKLQACMLILPPTALHTKAVFYQMLSDLPSKTKQATTGWLSKKGEGTVLNVNGSSWRDRYFSFERAGCLLKYYLDQEAFQSGAKPVGCVKIACLYLIPEREACMPNRLDFFGKSESKVDTILCISASTKSLMYKWIRGVSGAVAVKHFSEHPRHGTFKVQQSPASSPRSNTMWSPSYWSPQLATAILGGSTEATKSGLYEVVDGQGLEEDDDEDKEEEGTAQNGDLVETISDAESRPDGNVAVLSATAATRLKCIGKYLKALHQSTVLHDHMYIDLMGVAAAAPGATDSAASRTPKQNGNKQDEHKTSEDSHQEEGDQGSTKSKEREGAQDACKGAGSTADACKGAGSTADAGTKITEEMRLDYSSAMMRVVTTLSDLRRQPVYLVTCSPITTTIFHDAHFDALDHQNVTLEQLEKKVHKMHAKEKKREAEEKRKAVDGGKNDADGNKEKKEEVDADGNKEKKDEVDSDV
jgi:hypothetical protein